MREPQVLVFEEMPSIERGAGVSTKPLVKPEHGATAFVNGVTSFPTGGSMPWHTHNVDESVILLEGRGQFQSEEISKEVKPWDAVFVPAGISHRFLNVGDGPMHILWIYGGTHVTRTFVETGQTVVHLSDEDRRAQRD